MFTQVFLPQGKVRTQTLQARAGTDSLPSVKLTKLECWQSSLEPESPLREPYLSDTLPRLFFLFF